MSKANRNILVVDDEPRILEAVTAFLESKGFRVFRAENGRRALEIFDSENILLVILDLMLPDISGEEVCRIIRKKSRAPILMLTAKADEESLLEGLGLGADDYITKPFSLKALYARMEAVLRRTRDDLVPLAARNSFGDGDLVVDFEQNVVKKKQTAVALTPSEMKILAALIKYPGKVFTRASLIELTLGYEYEGYERTIDSHIKNLRQKIEDDPKAPRYVLTVYGLGYRFGGI